jgi:hypothetical protein
MRAQVSATGGGPPVRIALQHCQQVGQNSAVKAGVGLLSEVEQLLTRITARHFSGIDIKEVSRLGPGEQRGHLASDNVIDMQDRTDIHHHGRQRRPVRSQLDLVQPIG